MKRATKCQSTEEETTSLDNSSIFTDEDFRKFEEEYRLFAIKKNAKIGDQLISWRLNMYLNQIELNKKIDLLTNINQINNLILYIDYDVNK